MSRRCQVTGRTPGSGKHVSHSHVRTPRTFGVNVQDKRYWVPSLGRHVRLRLSAKGIKVVDRLTAQHADRGIESVVAAMRRQETKRSGARPSRQETKRSGARPSRQERF